MEGPRIAAQGDRLPESVRRTEIWREVRNGANELGDKWTKNSIFYLLIYLCVYLFIYSNIGTFSHCQFDSFLKGILIAQSDVQCKVNHLIFSKIQRFPSDGIAFLVLKRCRSIQCIKCCLKDKSLSADW